MKLIYKRIFKKPITFLLTLLILYWLSNTINYNYWFSKTNLNYTIHEQLELALNFYNTKKLHPFFLNPFEFVEICTYLDNRSTLPLLENFIGFSFIPHPYHFQPYNTAIINNITPHFPGLSQKIILELCFKNLTLEEFFDMKNSIKGFFNQNFTKVCNNLDLAKIHSMSNIFSIENDFIIINDFTFLNSYTEKIEDLTVLSNNSKIINTIEQLLLEFRNPTKKSCLENKEEYFLLQNQFKESFFKNPYHLFTEILKNKDLQEFLLNYSFYQQHYIKHTLLSTNPEDLINYLKNQKHNPEEELSSFWFRIFNLITVNDFIEHLLNKKDYNLISQEFNFVKYNSDFRQKRNFLFELKKNLNNLPENSILKQEFIKFQENFNNEKFYSLIKKYYNIDLK